MRRLVFDQSSPVHPVSESRGVYPERDGRRTDEGRTDGRTEILVSNFGCQHHPVSPCTLLYHHVPGPSKFLHAVCGPPCHSEPPAPCTYSCQSTYGRAGGQGAEKGGQEAGSPGEEGELPGLPSAWSSLLAQTQEPGEARTLFGYLQIACFGEVL